MLTVAEQETKLLTEVAACAAVDASGLRWWVVCTKTGQPRSIVIVKRGKRPIQGVLTISPTNNAHLWDRWQTVRDNWLAQRAGGSKRVIHAEIGADQI